MAGQRHADEHTHDQGTTGTAMKRRGILAAAAAMVAGIVAKQTGQPVAAGSDGDVIAAQTTATYGPTTVAGHEPGVPNLIPYGFGGDAVYTGSAATLPDTNLGTNQPYSVIGVKGIGKGNGPGVQGNGGGDTSTNITGFPVGVRGSVPDTGFGVYGNVGNGTGVYGVATGGNGVGGVTNGGAGVSGSATGGTGVVGVSTSGLGALLQGGRAPLRLAPGPVAAANLAAAGHQAGELYVTSDYRIFFFDGTVWQELAFVQPVVRGNPPPAPAARASGSSVAPTPVQPIPPGRP